VAASVDAETVIWESLHVGVPVGVADGVLDGLAVFEGVTLGVDEAAGAEESLATGVSLGEALGVPEPRPVSSQRTPRSSARMTRIATTRRTQ
jgi:hypothetical protein